VKDLFGDPPPVRKAYAGAKITGNRPVDIKLRNNYRKSLDVIRKCQTCEQHLRNWLSTYHKCDLLGGDEVPGTDINVGFVCDKWVANE